MDKVKNSDSFLFQFGSPTFYADESTREQLLSKYHQPIESFDPARDQDEDDDTNSTSISPPDLPLSDDYDYDDSCSSWSSTSTIFDELEFQNFNQSFNLSNQPEAETEPEVEVEFESRYEIPPEMDIKILPKFSPERPVSNFFKTSIKSPEPPKIPIIMSNPGPIINRRLIQDFMRSPTSKIPNPSPEKVFLLTCKNSQKTFVLRKRPTSPSIQVPFNLIPIHPPRASLTKPKIVKSTINLPASLKADLNLPKSKSNSSRRKQTFGSHKNSNSYSGAHRGIFEQLLFGEKEFTDLFPPTKNPRLDSNIENEIDNSKILGIESELDNDLTKSDLAKDMDEKMWEPGFIYVGSGASESNSNSKLKIVKPKAKSLKSIQADPDPLENLDPLTMTTFFDPQTDNHNLYWQEMETLYVGSGITDLDEFPRIDHQKMKEADRVAVQPLEPGPYLPTVSRSGRRIVKPAKLTDL